MKTITIQIGNSDDKLPQSYWSRFCHEMIGAIQHYATEIHFSGYSLPNARWQNAAFVFTIDESLTGELSECVVIIRDNYGQDSVALTEGETRLI